MTSDYDMITYRRGYEGLLWILMYGEENKKNIREIKLASEIKGLEETKWFLLQNWYNNFRRDDRPVNIMVDNTLIRLDLWDSHGSSEYDRIRYLTYENVVFTCIQLFELKDYYIHTYNLFQKRRKNVNTVEIISKYFRIVLQE